MAGLQELKHPDFPLPEKLDNFLCDVVDRIEANRPVQGNGISVTDVPGGKGRSVANKNAAGSGGVATLPFRVFWQAKPAPGEGFQLGVMLESTLQKTRAWDSGMNITGTLTADKPQDDPGWKDILPGATKIAPDIVWIKVTGNPETGAGAASIESKGNEDDFGGGEIEHDGGTGSPIVFKQAYARLVLAKVWFASNEPDANPQIEQLEFTNLVVKNSVEDSLDSDGEDPRKISAIYPEPR